jgi:hypothetical protein
MSSFFVLLILFLILMAVGIPLTAICIIALAATLLTLGLWVGIQVFKLFLFLIPTVIVGILAAKLARRLGCQEKMSENIGIAATLPCLYYFFFA